MLAHDLGLDGARIHVQVPSQMKPEAEAVKIRAGAQDTAEAALTDKVGQRVGWIGDDEHDRTGCSLGDLGKDLVIDFCVGVEQLEPAGGIIPGCFPPSLPLPPCGYPD